MSNLGRQFPKVPESVSQVYSGGKGHIDESGSATGMVPVSSLIKFKELDRKGAHGYSDSQERIDSIAADIKSGKGIKNPIMIAYDHNAKWGYIGEGHHRLEAAIQAGASHIPVTVYRQHGGMSSRRKEGRGSHLAMITDFGDDKSAGWSDGKYVPTNIHPYHFKQFMP